MALRSDRAGCLPGPVCGRLLLRRASVGPGGAAGGGWVDHVGTDPARGVVSASAVHRSRAGVCGARNRWRDHLRPDPGARPVTWRSALSVVLVCLGAGLGVIATLGVTVMRDWQDRVHYAGLSAIGTVLIGLSVLVRESF